MGLGGNGMAGRRVILIALTGILLNKKKAGLLRARLSF
jgi:hypothetical protein